MANHLVIVESPAKAKTIKKYLGPGYEVLASYGHVRDLLPKEGAVDPEHDFAMHYQSIDRNKKHVDTIIKALKKADTLYLATDPDREGEAISWHLCELLHDKKLLKDKAVHRVVFHEITKRAIKAAVADPRDISMDLVNAQQARRALDYLVGFTLSPLLWKKIRKGLSAGRVQSPALRMIVEREIEIEQFIKQEYWTIEADVQKDSHPFLGKLIEYKGKKLKQFDITEDNDAHAVRDHIINVAKGFLNVSKVEKKQRKRNPAPPFTTSTLQQEAARKLGFSTKRTMQVAQQLYEGVETKEGTTGLITYMRTDSVSLSQDALDEMRHYIGEHFGQEYLPEKPRFYKTKAKNAQEAHEAVRPTSAMRAPAELKASLSSDQYKLYQLIWKRAVACQMAHAVINTVSIDLRCDDIACFRSTGSTIAFPGFMRLYQEGLDDKKSDDNDDKLLPPMVEGDRIKLIECRAEQHFTEPPPRYTEASLVKALEEYGIGRPSTYSSIISTLQNREYVILDQKRFRPTDVGRVVARFLTGHFTRYVDYGFTANLEDELDAVARGELAWVPLLEKFWQPFVDQIKTTDSSVTKKDITQEPTDEDCPKCGKQLMIRLGKMGRFIGCSGYPECDYTRNIESDLNSAESNEPEVVEGRNCPKCQSPLYIRQGRYGKFIGCSSYPDCNFIEPLVKPVDTSIQCPQCQKGNIFERKSKKGKVFFSCERFPKCRYALWYPPVDKPCPKCDWPILIKKTTKAKGTQTLCPQEGCDYIEE